jgi:hypothetical protein
LSSKNYVIYYIFLTIFGIIILILISLLSKTESSLNFYDKIVVTSAFIICCIIGISLSLYPSWFKMLLKNQINLKKDKNIIKKIKFVGHHPDCENFKSHTIKISKKTYCAGCLGLSIGFTISIIITLIYVLYENIFISNNKFLIFYIGLISLIIVFVEISTITKRIIHIFSNIFFIIAILLIFLAILEITKDKTYGFISIMISFIFIETRIHLSKLKHIKTCKNCFNDCKMYI